MPTMSVYVDKCHSETKVIIHKLIPQMCTVFSFGNLCLVVFRGKCKVRPFVEIDSVKGYIQKDDCFFYVLGYNPETRYVWENRKVI